RGGRPVLRRRQLLSDVRGGPARDLPGRGDGVRRQSVQGYSGAARAEPETRVDRRATGALESGAPQNVAKEVPVPVVDSHCHVSPVWYEPVEVLLSQMERNGVDHAVLIQMAGQANNDYQF